MALLHLTSINLSQNELQNVRLQNLATDPGTPVEGQFYYNTTTDLIRYYDGTPKWVDIMGDINDLTAIGGAVVPANDLLAVWDDSASANVKVSVATLLSDSLAGVYEVPLTFQNGLTRTVNTVALGGDLLANTSINGNFTLSRVINLNGNALNIQNTNALGTAIYAQGGSTGTAVHILAGSTASAIVAHSSNANISTAQFYNNNTTSTASVTDGITLLRGGTFTEAAGNGVRIHLAARSGGTSRNMVSLEGVATDVTTNDGAFDLFTSTANSLTRKMRVASTGQLTIDTYGTGTHTGTPVNITAVDVSGNLVESNIGGVSAFADAGAFGSGDKLLIYDSSATALRKIDYDDLPGASGTLGYTTVTGDTGTASATSAETLNFTGTGIVTAVTADTTDYITFSLDFTQLTNETILDAADEFAFYDASAPGMRAITYTALLAELETDLDVSNYTFENGLTEAAGVVKLGGTLTANTTIDAGTTSTLTVTGTDAASVMEVTHTSGNGSALNVSATGNVYASTFTNTGSGGAINAVANTAAIVTSSAFVDGTQIQDAIIINRSSSAGNGAAGIGAGIRFNLEDAAGAITNSGGLYFSLTDATNNAHDSAFSLRLYSGGVLNRKLFVEDTGRLTLDTYGVGTHTGTAAKWLAVTAAGAVIEENAPVFAANAYSSFAGDTGGVITATGEEQITFVGGTGISTTSASGSPDTLTIDIDTSSEVTFTTTADWTFDNSVTGKGLFVTGPFVDDNHAVNKAYVDMLAAGLSGKDSVRAATTTAGTLATSFENGDIIDGITLVTNDRILIKNQAAPAENGIYIVQASGAPVRAEDANTWDELVSAYVWVEIGESLADTGWLCTSDQGGTLNTTAVTWVQFTGAYQLTAGEGLTKTGNTIDLDVNDLSVELAEVPALTDFFAVYDGSASATKKVTYANLVGVRKYAATVTVGTTPQVITHNLNTTDVIVQCYDTTSKDVIMLDIDITNANEVTVDAISTATVRVVIMG